MRPVRRRSTCFSTDAASPATKSSLKTWAGLRSAGCITPLEVNESDGLPFLETTSDNAGTRA